MKDGDIVKWNEQKWVYGEGEFVVDDDEVLLYSGLWNTKDWENEYGPSYCIVESFKDFKQFDDGTWDYVLASNLEESARYTIITSFRSIYKTNTIIDEDMISCKKDHITIIDSKKQLECTGGIWNAIDNWRSE